MAIVHIDAEQVVGHPTVGIGWIGCTFIPLQGTDAIPNDHDNIGEAIFIQIPGRHARSSLRAIDHMGGVVGAAGVLEPGPPDYNIGFAILIDMRFGDPFAKGAVDRGGGPRGSRLGIGGNLRQVELCQGVRGIPGGLVPIEQLIDPIAIEVAEELIVVDVIAAILDQEALPGHIGLVGWIGVLPPPQLVAEIVPPQDEIQVAIAVDVMPGAARFDVERA